MFLEGFTTVKVIQEMHKVLRDMMTNKKTEYDKC
jgi:hypothetical protein